MSNVTTLNNSNFRVLTTEYVEIQNTLIEAQKAAKESSEPFFNQLKINTNFYNNIVRNLSIKFNSEETTFQHLYSTLCIPDNSELIKFSVYTNEYIFLSNGTERRVPSYLLTNDPIAIAQYVRKRIRSMQDTARIKRFDTAKASKARVLREFNHAQRNLKSLEATFDLIEKQQEKRTTMVTNRMVKKSRKRSANTQ